LSLRTEDRPAEFEPREDASPSVAPPSLRQPERYGFEAAVAAFEAEVMASCAPELEWPARIAAGIRAALAFAAANPEAARALTIDSRADEPEEADDYLRMIARFAELLGQDAPQAQRLPASSDQAVVSAIAMIVSSHLRAGTIDRLCSGDTDMVFLVLLPYVGFNEASRWSSHI
jgi:hypothetical protein